MEVKQKIKLTQVNRIMSNDEFSPLVVPDTVIIRQWQGKTFIDVSDNATYEVAETIEEVTRKILEYKLAMVRYGNSVQISYQKNVEELGVDPINVSVSIDNQIHQLAGLEE